MNDGTHIRRRIDTLTLRAFCVLCDFESNVEIGRALDARGTPLPRQAVHQMMTGRPSWPAARAALAALLDVTTDRLETLIANSERRRVAHGMNEPGDASESLVSDFRRFLRSLED